MRAAAIRSPSMTVRGRRSTRLATRTLDGGEPASARGVATAMTAKQRDDARHHQVTRRAAGRARPSRRVSIRWKTNMMNGNALIAMWLGSAL